MRTLHPLLITALLVGCGHAPAGELRYVNAAPVWQVDDRKPVAAAPSERRYNRTLYHTDGYLVRRATRAMDLPVTGRALDVNSLDEVPDSSWFTNRIGVRELTLDELRRGPAGDPSPDQFRPWTIVAAKSGGTSLGFVFEDTRKFRFLLKFDLKHLPEMETAAHIIGHRIVSAIGYNVPEDHLARIRRADLVIAPDAKKKDLRGNKTPLTAEDLDAALAQIAIDEDGSFRVLASRFVPGRPIGPYAREGTRSDDRNDLIPHERRRSVRGQFAIFSWLNHTDMQEDNTLDAYVEDPADPARRYVAHYLIDFGKAFGSMGAFNALQSVGHAHRLDVDQAAHALVGFGLWERPWEDVHAPALRGVGLFEAASYRPGEWRANSMYWPYEDKDRFDGFWGAKLLIRFTRAQLVAIVDEAKLSDPAAAAYMVDTLVARQQKTARYWFDQVAPLDTFAVTGAGGTLQVCFSDLTLAYALSRVPAGTTYRIDAFDYAGEPTGATRTAVGSADGRTCVDGITAGADHAGYTIARFTVHRAGRDLPPVAVHVARDATGTPRVIGLRRE